MRQGERELTSNGDTVGSDDEQARRLLSLVLTFSNVSRPLSSEEIRQAHYPELSAASFLRQFSRDRERLAAAGLFVRRERRGKEAYWHAELASFADVEALSASDALLVDILCSPIASDPAFPRHEELRHALAKLDGTFGSPTAAHGAKGSGGKAFSALLACLEERTVAQVRYVDAQGRRSNRAYEPWGTFGLRGHTYIVCALHDVGDASEEPQMRTLRDDRVQGVRRLSQRFEVPADFCASDFQVLPFQIGPSIGMARLRAPEGCSERALAALQSAGTQLASRTWELPLSSIEECAAWAVSAGVVAEGPEALRDCWRTLLRDASHDEAQRLAAPRNAVTAGTSDGKGGDIGRHTAETQTRELIALVGALREQGATITAEAVSSRLAISLERARELLMLVLTSSSCGMAQLPLALSDDEDELVLCFGQGVRGRPLRFTQRESDAVEEAFDLLGFAADDELRLSVRRAFGPSGHAADALPPSAGLDGLPEGHDNDLLEACSRALADGAGLSFAYQGAQAGRPARRAATPLLLYRQDELWYLDAYDLDRKAVRTFRLDRMQDLRITGGSEAQTPSARAEATRTVLLGFEDPHLLELLEWPHLALAGRRGGLQLATIPYYGGTWLPRQLAACGRSAVTSDQELAEATRAEARRLLEQDAS